MLEQCRYENCCVPMAPSFVAASLCEASRRRLQEKTFARGCSSVVEHLLANEYRSNDPKLSNAICSARAQVNPAIHVILTLSETL